MINVITYFSVNARLYFYLPANLNINLNSKFLYQFSVDNHLCQLNVQDDIDKLRIWLCFKKINNK